MDVLEAITAKRDTRELAPDPVAGTDLDRVLRAGRMAGSAKNAQVTRIVVVTADEERHGLRTAGDFTDWIHVAPVHLVLVAPVEGLRLFDLGRMAQNMMLAAHALGLASCPVTFHHQDRVRAVLGVPSDHEGPMAVVLGHPGPAAPTRVSAPRIALDELVHRGRWQG